MSIRPIDIDKFGKIVITLGESGKICLDVSGFKFKGIYEVDLQWWIADCIMYGFPPELICQQWIEGEQDKFNVQIQKEKSSEINPPTLSGMREEKMGEGEASPRQPLDVLRDFLQACYRPKS